MNRILLSFAFVLSFSAASYAGGISTPPLPAQSGQSGKFLTTDGSVPSWASVSGGSGDVVGPSSSFDNAIVRFDGLTGKLIQNGAFTISDLGDVSGIHIDTAGALNIIKINGTSLTAVTGTGSSVVLSAGPTFTGSPVLSTATATSINKVAITAPASGSTLTIGDGFTLTANGNATVSGTNTGDQTTISGNAATATALQTARAIGGVNFDGTAAIVPQTIQTINEATDTTTFPLFVSASGSQSLQPLNNASLTFNSNTGALSATSLGGTLTTAAQANVTSLGSLTGLTVAGTGSVTSTSAPQLTVAYDGSNKLTTSISSTGSATYALTGTSPVNTFSQRTYFTGGFASSSTVGNANIASPSDTSVSSGSAANIIIGGASTQDYRILSRGATNATLDASASYASFMMGQTAVTEAASGTHPILAAVAIKPLAVTAGVATVTNSATLYIEGADNTTTASGAYALWVDANESRFDGDIGDTTNRVNKLWSIDGEFTNCPTLGGTACSGSAGLARTTSPVFITPTLGAASATSLSFSSTSGIIGTTTNNNAAAGSVGETIESTVLVGAAISATTGTPLNVTSISLTAGDWQVWGTVNSAVGGTTVTQTLEGSLSTTTATIETYPNGGGNGQTGSAVAGFSGDAFMQKRISVGTTTTIFLNARGYFTVSTLGVYGYIGARRVR